MKSNSIILLAAMVMILLAISFYLFSAVIMGTTDTEAQIGFWILLITGSGISGFWMYLEAIEDRG